MTSSILETNWCIFKWPYDMTHLNQPLVLALNEHCKSYMKITFTEWYSKDLINDANKM